MIHHGHVQTEDGLKGKPGKGTYFDTNMEFKHMNLVCSNIFILYVYPIPVDLAGGIPPLSCRQSTNGQCT